VALFLSGSYTEWVEAFRQPEWGCILDGFCEVVRAASVPILAVCGSHQLMAYAFGGWQSVGHMARAGTAPVAIFDESDAVFRAPNPRIGEVGTFLYRREVDDPLFASLTDDRDGPLIFSQWHCDQVLSSALPPGAVSLLRPAGLNRAVQDRELTSRGVVTVTPGEPAVPYSHRSVETAEESCRVQALRYDVPPTGRVLYATQFHPDLAGKDSAGNADHGIRLLHNFLDIATAYWNSP
jgi:GMP synthase-like glutamine amidotransferase